MGDWDQLAASRFWISVPNRGNNMDGAPDGLFARPGTVQPFDTIRYLLWKHARVDIPDDQGKGVGFFPRGLDRVGGVLRVLIDVFCTSCRGGSANCVAAVEQGSWRLYSSLEA